MAKQEKEQIIFELSVEPQSSLTELEKLKGAIRSGKDELKKLDKAFKDEIITEKEWLAETVRIEAQLKRNQSAYNNIQKSVTGVKTQLDKLIDSNKKISKSFEETASQINVAGVNISSLGTRIASLANPYTAAIGLAGGLFAAYQKSTIGAKDLEFAHNQLAGSIQLVSNRFAEMISSSEDGEGFFSRLTDSFINLISPQIAAESKLLANLGQQMEDLQRTEIEIRGKVSDRLTENQEKLTAIANEQTDFNEKVELGNEIVTNLRNNQIDLKKVLDDQLTIIIAQLSFDEKNEALLTLKLQKEREINKLVSDTEKKIQGQKRANTNLIEAEGKRIAEISRNLGTLQSLATEGPLNTSIGQVAQSTKQDKVQDSSIIPGTLAVVDSQKVAAEALAGITSGIVENNQKQARSYAEKAATAKKASEDEVKAQQAVQYAIQQAASIFGENTVAYKLLASADAVMNTYKGANIALGTYPPPFSYIAAAATVAAGLANVAQINNVDLGGAAAGGGNFLTKGPTMLMVGDNPGGVERVTVEPLSGKGQTKIWGPNLMAFGGGGSVTTAGDGGLFMNSSAGPIEAQMLQRNAMKEMIKSMPPQVVIVRDIQKGLGKVGVKDKFSSLR